ncbi:MAG: hypothetical protein ACFHU9_11695 [Fluviicola sp.]
MKKANTFIYNFLDSIQSILKIVILSRRAGILSKKENVDKCIILGNGPSFIHTYKKYRTELMSLPTICVNHFAETEMYEDVKPQYYVVQSTIFFLPDDDIPAHYAKARNHLFQTIIDRTKWEMEILVPVLGRKSKEFQRILKENKHIKPLYYNDTGVEGFPWLMRLIYRKGWGIPRPHNVLIPSLMNTIKLGYRRIYITGADHSWLGEIEVDENNLTLINQKHFYDQEESKAQVMQDSKVRPRRLHEVLHKFYLSFRGYWDIKAYADKYGVSIYNCSETSLIDAFDRVPLSHSKTNMPDDL